MLSALRRDISIAQHFSLATPHPQLSRSAVTAILADPLLRRLAAGPQAASEGSQYGICGRTNSTETAILGALRLSLVIYCYARAPRSFVKHLASGQWAH